MIQLENTTKTQNSVLGYEREIYQSYYEDEFIVDFIHKSFATGVVDVEEVQKTVTLLNEIAQKETQNISFNPGRIKKGEQLTGGACSTVALRVAQAVVELFEKLNKRDKLNDINKHFILLNRIRRVIEEFNVAGTKRTPQSENFRKQTRSIQYAFNTITVDRTREVQDVCQDKIKALAAYYELNVSYSTPSVDVKNLAELELNVNKQLKSLKCGVHLLRMIDYKYNHKLENQGHSATYIKTPVGEIYFDPALGLYQLLKEDGKTNLIYNALLSAQLRYKVDLFSFHKLEKRVQSQRLVET